jgi:nitroreductase
MSFLKTIESMKTVRDYHDTVVPTTILKRLINLTKPSPGLLPSNSFSLRIIEDGLGFFELMSGKAGYYGKMIQAPHYIVLFDKVQNGVYENSGYVMEKLRLSAWEEDLGTCWISIDEPLDLSAWVEEPVTDPPMALVAIGYPESGIFRQDVLKKSARLPLTELVFLEKWNRPCSLDQLETRGLSEILYYGKLAPSWGNRQPWRFILHREQIYLTVHAKDQETRARIDAGIVMLYVQQAAHDRGLSMNWQLIPPNDSLSETLQIPDSEHLIACLT